jgi:aminopeptidase
MGRGFDICVDNFAKYTKEELISLGVNDSMIHVDFMIGTDDLEVSGITEDGTEVAIFRNGDWVF